VSNTWTSSQAAEFLKVSSSDNAGRVLRQAGYQPVGREPGRGGQNLWDSTDVRQYAALRQQGARTDRQKELQVSTIASRRDQLTTIKTATARQLGNLVIDEVRNLRGLTPEELLADFETEYPAQWVNPRIAKSGAHWDGANGVYSYRRRDQLDPETSPEAVVRWLEMTTGVWIPDVTSGMYAPRDALAFLRQRVEDLTGQPAQLTAQERRDLLEDAVSQIRKAHEVMETILTRVQFGPAPADAVEHAQIGVAERALRAALHVRTPMHRIVEELTRRDEECGVSYGWTVSRVAGQFIRDDETRRDVVTQEVHRLEGLVQQLRRSL
jgi:hypothetical protein